MSRARSRAVSLPRWAQGALAILVSGCGYTAGLDLGAEGIHTVALEVVGNQTFRQRFEIPLTRQIERQLPARTGLRLASRATADAILRVEIQDIRERTLVVGNTPVLEGALIYEIRARLIDRQSGTILRDKRILDRAEFRVPVGENASTARAEASADLARKVILALEPDF